MSYPPPDAHPQPYPQRSPGGARQPPAGSALRRRILRSTAAALILAVGIGIVGTLNGCDKTPPAGGALKVTVTTTAVVPLPKSADVRLTAKVTGKTCRVDAGCEVTWHAEVAYSGSAVSSNLPWMITYEVTGIESDDRGRLIEMNGTTPAKQSDQHVRTAESDRKIVLKVTNVLFGHLDLPPGIDVHLNAPVVSAYR